MEDNDVIKSPWTINSSDFGIFSKTFVKKCILFNNNIWSIHIYNIYNFDLYFKLNIRRATFNLFYFFGIILVFSDNQKFYILISWLNNSPLRRFFFICINEISVHLTDILSNHPATATTLLSYIINILWLLIVAFT